eukprot:CFRG8390T1
MVDDEPQLMSVESNDVNKENINKDGVKVWPLTLVDEPAKPDLVQPYDAAGREGVPIVIDIGAFYTRAGFADKPEPQIVFRSRVARGKRSFGETGGVIVGNDISNKEALRVQFRNYMEAGVVTNFATQEDIFDHIFSRLGINTPTVKHPIVLTEMVCSPIYTRARFFEMLYEAYGVERVTVGVDPLFSMYYEYYTKLGPSRNLNPGNITTLVIQIGHSAMHVIPVIDRHMDAQHCKRINIGVASMIHYLHRLLRLKYPHHAESFTDIEIEEMLFKHAYISRNFLHELVQWENAEHTKAHTRVIQLPFVRPDPISIEERRKRKEEQGKRLQDLMRRKREKKLAEAELQLEKLVAVLSWPTDQKQRVERKKLGYPTLDEFNVALDDLKDSVRRQRNKLQGIEEPEVVEEKKELVFDLVDRPDSELTDAQKQEKKKQRFLKNTTEGRERARLERERIKAVKDEEERHDSLRREANPEAWILALREEKEIILKTRTARIRKKEALKNSRSGVSKQRMRLMVKQFDDTEEQTGGSGRRSKRTEDTFGKNDREWDVYRVLGNDDDGSEDEREEVALTHIESKLAEHDPAYSGENAPVDIETYNQVSIGVERFRVAEILFQPSMIGDGEAGLIETLEWVLQYYPVDVRANLVRNIHVTGGGCQLPGFKERLVDDIRAVLPHESEFSVNITPNPHLDSWKGASVWALSQLEKEKVHKDMETKSVFLNSHPVDLKVGLVGLMEHECSNKYYTLP